MKKFSRDNFFVLLVFIRKVCPVSESPTKNRPRRAGASRSNHSTKATLIHLFNARPAMVDDIYSGPYPTMRNSILRKLYVGVQL